MKPNFDFQEKFGHIAHFMPDDDLMYEQNSSGRLFRIPRNIKEKRLEFLMERSLTENKDFVFEMVKDHEFILDRAVDY